MHTNPAWSSRAHGSVAAALEARIQTRNANPASWTRFNAGGERIEAMPYSLLIPPSSVSAGTRRGARQAGTEWAGQGTRWPASGCGMRLQCAPASCCSVLSLATSVHPVLQEGLTFKGVPYSVSI